MRDDTGLVLGLLSGSSSCGGWAQGAAEGGAPPGTRALRVLSWDAWHRLGEAARGADSPGSSGPAGEGTGAEGKGGRGWRLQPLTRGRWRSRPRARPEGGGRGRGRGGGSCRRRLSAEPPQRARARAGSRGGRWLLRARPVLSRPAPPRAPGGGGCGRSWATCWRGAARLGSARSGQGMAAGSPGPPAALS